MSDKISNPNFLRTTALIVLFVGAVGSLGLMFNAGRNQKSFILMALFTIWDISPFAGLFAADKLSNRWSALTRVSLYCLIFVITAGSLIAYSGVLNPPDTKNAFMFLVVPFISWALIVTVIAVTALISRRQSHNNI